MTDIELKEAKDARIACEALPFARNLGAFLDQAAQEMGNKTALHLIATDRELSALDIQAMSRSVAAGLKAKGVNFGDRVGVMLGNVLEFPLTWLAIARLGAVMVPINNRYTPREVAYVLGDSGAMLLVTDAATDANLRGAPELAGSPAMGCRVVVGGEGADSWEALAAYDAATFLPDREPELDDLLNIQYTSGTTGLPKGCMLTHRYWLVLSRVAAFRIKGDIRNVLSAQPFYYMDPQWQLLMALYLRGTVFLAERPSSSSFLGWVHRYRIGYCIFPQIVLKQPAEPRDAELPLALASIFGWRRDAHLEIERRFNVTARESFGMTEVGSALSVPYWANDMVGSGSCGIPSPFREASIRNAEGAPVPDGEIGELWVRGPGIMLGYWNKPEANADSLRPGGWFRTGDLFRRDAKGFFYIVGRVKDMIRRSGENIAANEVEAVLTGWPDVLEAAVIGVPDADRGEEVKACLVLRPPATRETFDLAALAAHCAQHLAVFKVPRYFEIRDSLPKTPSEKVAKHLLRSEKPDLRAGAFDQATQQWN
ncbi:class I adenylate-forming enzyme family protein [soil metagenome]